MKACMVSLCAGLQGNFGNFTVFDVKTAQFPLVAGLRANNVNNVVGRLRDVGWGYSFRSSRMRVEDAQQFESVAIDPIKGIELFIWIHHDRTGLCA